MHYVIMGCGRVGAQLAKALYKRGHSVAIIDQNRVAFVRLGDFGGTKVLGVGYDREVLKKAEIEKADGFAAVSSGDNSNILAARVVRETFGVRNVVARIYDHGRAEVYERLGIPTVASVRWTTDQVLRALLPDGAQPLWQDPSGNVRLIEVGPHDGWVGQTIAAARSAIHAPIPFLTRFGQGMVPGSEVIIQEGDLIYAAVRNDQIAEVERKLGQPPVGH